MFFCLTWQALMSSKNCQKIAPVLLKVENTEG